MYKQTVVSTVALMLLANTAAAADPILFPTGLDHDEDDGSMTMDPQPSVTALVGRVSVPLARSQMENGAPLWEDIGVEWAVLKGVKESQTGLPLWVPPTRLAEDTEVTLRCPEGRMGCEAWVFMYHCPSGCGNTYQGGLTAELLRKEWTPTQCAPSFKPRGADYQQPMRSMRLSIEAGHTKTIKLVNPAAYVFFGMRFVYMQCSEVEHEGTCDWESAGQCQWVQVTPSLGRCEPTGCRNHAKGPAPPCPPCPPEPLDLGRVLV